MLMVRSQPSFMPRFSAAIEGWRIHCWMRCTASSWRFSISFQMGCRSESWVGANLVKASAAALAAAELMKSRRFMANRILKAKRAVQRLGLTAKDAQEHQNLTAESAEAEND